MLPGAGSAGEKRKRGLSLDCKKKKKGFGGGHRPAYTKAMWDEGYTKEDGQD